MIHPALHRFLANQIGLFVYLFIYLIRHKTINTSSKHPVTVGNVTTRMQSFMMPDAGSAQAPQESCCILLLFTVTQIPVQTPQILFYTSIV